MPGELLILSDYEAPGPPEEPVLTKRLVSGLSSYADSWDGQVTGLFHPASAPARELDVVTFKKGEGHRFNAEIVPFGSPAFAARLGRAAVVLGGPNWHVPELAVLCERARVPLVLNTEVTLLTRLQIARSEERRPLRLLKRSVWELGDERSRRSQVRKAASVQCNGTPTHAAYRALSNDALLYFDSRLSADLLPSDAEMAASAARLRSGAPLRLVFSGRLAPIKGVMHFAPMAAALRKASVPFLLDIFGGGPMEQEMRASIRREHLDDVVTFHGSVDFRGKLMPWLRENADLFVCLHVQGDPSCTYLETLGAGVPIVGFSNEAWEGMVELDAGIGWQVPVGDTEALIARITALHADREALVRAKTAARAFADARTMERTFAQRVEHLKRHARR